MAFRSPGESKAEAKAKAQSEGEGAAQAPSLSLAGAGAETWRAGKSTKPWRFLSWENHRTTG